jgi:hypothetical protein
MDGWTRLLGDRACQDRAISGDPGHQLRGEALATPMLYQADPVIRGRKAKTAAEDRSRRQNCETRRATVEIRAASVTLRPPLRPHRKLPPATVNVVREPDPPAGEIQVGWIVVTTLPKKGGRETLFSPKRRLLNLFLTPFPRSWRNNGSRPIFLLLTPLSPS